MMTGQEEYERAPRFEIAATEWVASEDQEGTTTLWAREEKRSVSSRVYALSEEGRVDAALDVIYETVYDLLASRNSMALDRMLARLDVNRLETSILLAFLTATAPAKRFLVARAKLYQRAKAALDGREGAGKTQALLGKLE